MQSSLCRFFSFINFTLFCSSSLLSLDAAGPIGFIEASGEAANWLFLAFNEPSLPSYRLM